MNPSVSVVMSVYNGSDTLVGTLDSVLAQEDCDFEFIVVDDGSSDESGSILDAYAARDSRLRVIHQANSGLTRALMAGCAAALGEFIARQDAGDTSMPGRLSTQLQVLRGKKSAVAVTCDTAFIGPRGEPLYTSHVDNELLNASLAATQRGRLHGPSHHGSVMMRRDAYSVVGGYRPQFFFAQDLDLWSRIAEKGSFAVVSEVLYQARLDPQSISGTQTIEQRELAKLVALATWARHTGQSEDEYLALAAKVRPIKRSRLSARIASGNYFIGSCLARRDPRSACAYFQNAIAARPTHLRAWLKLMNCRLRAQFVQKISVVSARGR